MGINRAFMASHYPGFYYPCNNYWRFYSRPGFLALFLLIPIVSLMQPAMVVDDASPIGCFKKAWHAGKKNYLNLFALWLIYFAISAGISFFGAIFSYIPFFGWVFQLGANLFLWLVVYPMMLISFVDYYARNRSGARK